MERGHSVVKDLFLVKARFNEDEESRKKNGGGKHIFFFNEKMLKVFLFGWISIAPSWYVSPS